MEHKRRDFGERSCCSFPTIKVDFAQAVSVLLDNRKHSAVNPPLIPGVHWVRELSEWFSETKGRGFQCVRTRAFTISDVHYKIIIVNRIHNNCIITIIYTLKTTLG